MPAAFIPKMIKTFIFTCSLILIAHVGYAEFNECPDVWKINIGISYPPHDDDQQREFTQKHMKNLGVKHLRISEHWKYREPSQWNFKWRSLNNRMRLVEKNNYSLLLTIEANGPDWACSRKKSMRSCVFYDNYDLGYYVETLLKQFPNKINKLQFGNEMLSEEFYVGSVEDYIAANNAVYETVKKYSPLTKVVLGGFSTGTIRRFVACETDLEFPLYYAGAVSTDRTKVCLEDWVKKAEFRR